jgi:propanediol dehydratase small subunit
MSTIETIKEKVQRLPLAAQEEVLEAVRQIEQRYQAKESASEQKDAQAVVHPLTLIAQIAVDVGVTDLAERHDYYAHGKLED